MKIARPTLHAFEAPFSGYIVRWPQAREEDYLEGLEELISQCPRTFYDTKNPWSKYTRADRDWCGDATPRSTWIWKSEDPAIQEHQLGLWGFVSGGYSDTSRENAVALAAWMLSEMLVEVPVHTPPDIRM